MIKARIGDKRNIVEFGKNDVPEKLWIVVNNIKSCAAKWMVPPSDQEMTLSHILTNYLLAVLPASAIKPPDEKVQVMFTLTDRNVYFTGLDLGAYTECVCADVAKQFAPYINMLAALITPEPSAAAAPPVAPSIVPSTALEDLATAAALRDVRREWLDIIPVPELKKAFADIIRAGDFENITPRAERVLMPYVVTPREKLCAVMPGQDPYAKTGEATGIAFAQARGNKVPPSLVNIFKALQNCQLIKNIDEQTPDITFWARQGLLLPNAALTTRIGAYGAHLAIWRPFSEKLLTNVLALKPLVLFGLGKAAQEILQVAMAANEKRKGPEHKYLYWSHPSPQADASLPPEKKFAACPHFKAIPGIIWDQTQLAMIFTDGACSGNGKADAVASFSVACYGNLCRGVTIQGLVGGGEYSFVDEKHPECGFRIATDAKAVPPTNNRGELLAVCHALLYLLTTNFPGIAMIYSDSALTVGTYNEWYAKWVAESKTEKHVNLDIIRIGIALFDAVRRSACIVKLENIRASHNYKLAADATKQDKIIYAGNAKADALATEATRVKIILRTEGGYEVP